MARPAKFDKDDLIDRARDLFWQRGWAGTSIKDLQAALGLNPGSIYGTFGSKEALFELAMDRYVAGGASQLAALHTEHGPRGALARYPSLVIAAEGVPARACMLAKTVLELQPQDHPLATRANALLQRMGVRFADLFTEAQAAGDIDAEHDTQRLARRYQSDLLGLRVSAERDGVDAMEIAEEIAAGLRRL